MPVTEARLNRHYRAALPGICPEAMGPLRQIARAHLRLWGRTGLTEVVELGVTELLTNVCKHTAGDCELLMEETPDGVLVAVTDFDDRMPVVREVTDDREGGRGLFLLSALVDELVMESLPLGKRVSFRLEDHRGDQGGRSC
ncbi:ATP-binding protein [Kitasatospora purpeofusca]|uniref:ATP-binding protein n=1 Tax=Kitasatospora purpeofusca TaxID=67352 RepID=UPI003667763D